MTVPLRRRPTDAHEGPVYVPHQDRLYFCTRPDVAAAHPVVAIRYWDLATDALHTWVPDARMANGMALSCDAGCLLVCEQGDRRRPAAIARYRLRDARRSAVVEAFGGHPLNSPNKVAELPSGTLLFTDPDYGPRQGFRQDSPLTPALYAHYATGETARFELGLEQPHGLAVAPGANRVYVSDTSADDGVGGFDRRRRRDVYAYALRDDHAAIAVADRRHLARVPHGIPDGMAVDAAGRVIVACGDGVRAYAADGALAWRLPLAGGAVNLCLDEPGGRLFVTTDAAVEAYALPSA